jgi:hypothetical protein
MFILVLVDRRNTNASNPMNIIIKYNLAHHMPTAKPILISNCAWSIPNSFCNLANAGFHDEDQRDYRTSRAF